MVDDENWVERGDGLWSLCERFHIMGARFGRRMVMVKRNGWTGVFSPGSQLKSSVEAGFGKDVLIDGLIAPTAFHDTYFSEAAAAFPKAQRLVSAAFGKAVPDTCDLTEGWPEPWRNELTPFLLAGMPKVQESVIYDRLNQTLIVSDLFFYFDSSWDPWTKAFVRLAGAYGKPRISRLFRLCIQDRNAFKESVQPLLDLPIRQILPSHGKVVEGNGHRVLKDLLGQL